MPSWTTHLVTANRVNEIIKMDKNEFIFGNIMPDILVGYLIKDTSKIIKYSITHYTMPININGIELELPDINRFKKEYKDKIDNPIICGYYCHLMTDYFWNKYTYQTYLKSMNKEDLIEVKLKNKEKKIVKWDEATRVKQKDFEIFSNYLKKNNEIYYPVYDKKINYDGKYLKEINLTEDDIKKAIKYIENNIKNTKEEIQEEYEIFEREELEQKLNECIEFILENIRQIKE